MEGVLPLMVTTTIVPTLIQGQGKMDNSLSTLSGLIMEKQIETVGCDCHCQIVFKPRVVKLWMR